MVPGLFMVIHGSRLIFSWFQVGFFVACMDPGDFYVFFVVQGWSFMVPGRSVLYMVLEWFSRFLWFQVCFPG